MLLGNPEAQGPAQGRAGCESIRQTGTQLSRKLYVGNLSFTSTQQSLETLFKKHGTVRSVNVIADRDTGRSRGFAFVEMEQPEEAEQALLALDGMEFEGRSIKVNEAQREREDRPAVRRGF